MGLNVFSNIFLDRMSKSFPLAFLFFSLVSNNATVVFFCFVCDNIRFLKCRRHRVEKKIRYSANGPGVCVFASKCGQALIM